MVKRKSEDSRGHLALVTGPMFSGKTTELLRLHGRQKLAGKNCVLVKYAKDTRYDENLIATHDKHKCLSDTIKANELGEVSKRIFDESVDVVAIDEGQFFPDLADTCEKLVRAKKIVIVAALNARFDRKAFEQVSLIQPNANEISLLTAVCECGENAIFTYRKSTATEEELIGGMESYKACCRECYYKAEKEFQNAENILPNQSSDFLVSPEKKARMDPGLPFTLSIPKNGIQ